MKVSAVQARRRRRTRAGRIERRRREEDDVARHRRERGDLLVAGRVVDLDQVDLERLRARRAVVENAEQPVLRRHADGGQEIGARAGEVYCCVPPTLTVAIDAKIGCFSGSSYSFVGFDPGVNCGLLFAVELDVEPPEAAVQIADVRLGDESRIGRPRRDRIRVQRVLELPCSHSTASARR